MKTDTIDKTVASTVKTGKNSVSVMPEAEKMPKAEVCTVIPGVQLSERDALSLGILLKHLADSRSWAGRKAFQRTRELRPTATGFNELVKHRLEEGASKEDRAKTKLIQSVFAAFVAAETLEGGKGKLPQSIANAGTLKLLE